MLVGWKIMCHPQDFGTLSRLEREAWIYIYIYMTAVPNVRAYISLLNEENNTSMKSITRGTRYLLECYRKPNIFPATLVMYRTYGFYLRSELILRSNNH